MSGNKSQTSSQQERPPTCCRTSRMEAQTRLNSAAFFGEFLQANPSGPDLIKYRRASLQQPQLQSQSQPVKFAAGLVSNRKEA